MEIRKSFAVRAAPDAVWAFLTDPYQVAACLPGAAVTGRRDERTYEGTITVKVGPVASSYRGQLRFERLDAGARTAEIVATGQDVRGKGGADLRMTSQLVERAPGVTEVTVAQEIGLSGILVQMGRGMVQDVGDQLFERFTDAMRARLEAAAPPAGGGPPPASGPLAAAGEPIQVVSLGAGAAARALGRIARRPGLWVAVIVLALVVWWLWFR